MSEITGLRAPFLHYNRGLFQVHCPPSQAQQHTRRQLTPSHMPLCVILASMINLFPDGS